VLARSWFYGVLVSMKSYFVESQIPQARQSTAYLAFSHLPAGFAKISQILAVVFGTENPLETDVPCGDLDQPSLQHSMRRVFPHVFAKSTLNE
jgi:hypothetical protein